MSYFCYQDILTNTVSGVFEDNWDSQQGRPRTTSILVRAFWNFKLKVLKYSRNCSLQYTLIPNFWHPLVVHTYFHYLCTTYFWTYKSLAKVVSTLFWMANLKFELERTLINDNIMCLQNWNHTIRHIYQIHIIKIMFKGAFTYKQETI